MSLDLPPVPPPQAPRPGLNRPTTLLAGCGLGIAVVVLLGVVGAVLAIVVLPGRTLPKARVFVDGVYAKAEANKNLTKDQLAVYKEIADLVAAPDSGVFVVNVGGAVLYDHLKDGAVSDDETKEAAAVRDELQKEPNGGAMALLRYGNAHPELQERLGAFTRAVALTPMRM